jgi:phenylacetate-CoA ligase
MCLWKPFIVLETQETDTGDKYLHIAVELLPGIKPETPLSILIAHSVRTQLLRLNSEFAHYTPHERQLPQISLCAFADTEYFPVGVKHRYTRKT